MRLSKKRQTQPFLFSFDHSDPGLVLVACLVDGGALRSNYPQLCDLRSNHRDEQSGVAESPRR